MGVLMKLTYILKTDRSPVFLRKIHNMFAEMDVHDHGDIKVSNDSIEMDETFNFNNWAVGDLGAIGVVNIGQSKGELSVFFKDNECYLHPYGGDPFPLTLLGAFNATLVGAIVGDYSTSGAYFSYSSITKSYSFEDVTNIEYSDLYVKSVVVHSKEVENPSGVIISASDAMTEDVELTMPSDLPTASSLIMTASDGSLTFYPNTPLPNNSFLYVDGTGAISTVNIDFSFINVESPYKVFQFKGEGVSVGVVENEGVVLARGTTPERPLTPSEGMTRINTTLSTLEVFDGVEWKSVTMVSGDGLVLSDLTDVSTSNLSNLQFLRYDGSEWSNYSRPSVSWGDITSLPPDITDLSAHSFGELSDCAKPSSIPEGFVLGMVDGNITSIRDSGTTAVWGNLTGDIADQDLGIEIINGSLYDNTSASIQKRLSGWITEEEEKIYDSKIKIVDTLEEELLEEPITAGSIGLAVVNDFATTSTSIFDFANMPEGATPVNGQILKMGPTGNFYLENAETGESAPVFNKKDSIYTHNGTSGVALLAPESDLTTYILEASSTSDSGLKWVEAGGIENSPITQVFTVTSTAYPSGSVFPTSSISEGFYKIFIESGDFNYGQVNVLLGATVVKSLVAKEDYRLVRNLGVDAWSLLTTIKEDSRLSQFMTVFADTPEPLFGLDRTILTSYYSTLLNKMIIGYFTTTAGHRLGTNNRRAQCTRADGDSVWGGIGSNTPYIYDTQTDVALYRGLSAFSETAETYEYFFMFGMGESLFYNLETGDSYPPPDVFTRGWVNNYSDSLVPYFNSTYMYPVGTSNVLTHDYDPDGSGGPEVAVYCMLTPSMPDLKNNIIPHGVNCLKKLDDNIFIFQTTPYSGAHLVEKIIVDTTLNTVTKIDITTSFDSLITGTLVSVYFHSTIKGFITYYQGDNLLIQSFKNNSSSTYAVDALELESNPYTLDCSTGSGKEGYASAPITGVTYVDNILTKVHLLSRDPRGGASIDSVDFLSFNVPPSPFTGELKISIQEIQ